MKILYIFPNFINLAGTEKILTDKMNYFSEQPGYEVFLITYEQGNNPFSFQLSPKVKYIDLNIKVISGYNYHSNFLYRLIKKIKLKSLFKKELSKNIRLIYPDIIICTSYINIEIKTIANIKINSVKIIESHINKNYCEYKYKYKNNYIFSLYGTIKDHIMEKYYKKFDAIITLTSDDAKLWKNYGIVYTIPNFIKNIPSNIANYDNKKVLSIGRLNYQKGYDILIDAWNIVHSKYPDWQLSIVGKGESKEDLLKKIFLLNLQDSIHIENPTINIEKYYIENSIYVMSSRFEGFALVLLEAMSYGLPCVSFDCPYGPRDIIDNGKDGLLVEKINHLELANNICLLIDNKDLRKVMGSKARSNIKRLLPENIIPIWNNVFNSLIKNKKNTQ